MSKNRIPITKELSEQLLYQNRHACCICRELRKHVQIHHIDSNPSNNELKNLAVLCLDCHSLVSGDEGFGRSYSQNEVASYKKTWEKVCRNWLEGNTTSVNNKENESENEEEEVIDSDYTDDILKADTHLEFRYELEDGEGILLWVKSETPIYVAIMRKTDYKDWVKRKVTLEDACELLLENIIEKKEMFIADENDDYSVVIANTSLEDVWIQADISIWEFN